MHTNFLLLSDVPITFMDALPPADRANSTSAESCSMQLYAGPSPNQILWIGFRYDNHFILNNIFF